MRPRWMFGLVLFVVASMLLAACGGDDDSGEDGTGTETTEADTGAEAASVTTVDNSFQPSSLTLTAGEEVTIEVTNDGNNPHTFTIDDPAADTSTIDPGTSASVTFTMPDEAVTFYCAIHGQGTMSGTIEPG